MTVLASGSTPVTLAVMVVIPDNASAVGRIGMLSSSRHPRMTHGKVNPRKCEKSSSMMVMSRSVTGVADRRISLITLSPPIPAPTMTSFLLTVNAFHSQKQWIVGLLRWRHYALADQWCRSGWADGVAEILPSRWSAAGDAPKPRREGANRCSGEAPFRG
ncbi:hypothetical protein I546_1670 [Mycobacterium kansasii 732]|nr:hypothetical protein I546_1670 [Mycobacterium kansasii 732]